MRTDHPQIVTGRQAEMPAAEDRDTGFPGMRASRGAAGGNIGRVGFRNHHPEGMVENSPAFQRRDSDQREPSPEGTAEIDCLSRPSGTYPAPTSNPALKRRAIIVCPSGTKMAVGSKRTKIRAPRTSAFSLIEMMVAVTLLLIIIAALLAVFYQTQRAFRLTATQVDVLESGRAAMELLTGELPEISASGRDGQVNVYAQTAFPALIQPRPAPSAPRVNLIQDFFFLRQNNDDWIGTGYFVLPFSTEPIGTLYRFELSVTNVTDNSQIYWLFTNFLAATQQNPPPANSHRVIDQVVDLRISPYNAQGQFWTNYVDSKYSFTNSFTNSALPAYLDLELGILEPRAFERYKALADPLVKGTDPTRAFQYLSNHVEKVHLFHQRIPIRTGQ